MQALRIEEVAMIIGVSVQTLERWYKFKKEHPESEVAQEIPEYFVGSTTGARRTRLWTQEAVFSLMQFKTERKLGRTGKMGKYGGKGTHGKKVSRKKVNAQ